MNMRPYRASDLPSVLAFIGQCLRHDDLRNYHPGDIVHWMSNGQRGADLGEYFRLCERGGELLAFAEVPPAQWASYALIVHPEHRGGDLEEGLLLECQAIVRRRLRDETSDKTALSTNVAVSDTERLACLKRLGYRQEASTTVMGIRSLDTPIAASVLPPGFRMRSVAGEHEAALLAEVHSGAFGSDWTAEAYASVMRTPGFEFERELVVVAPDGRFAAFLVYWLDPISGSGLFEPVGCHPDFQRRGLTRALMVEALRRMAAAGMRVAQVGHNVGSEAAAGLYASVGFEEHFKTFDCSLPLV